MEKGGKFSQPWLNLKCGSLLLGLGDPFISLHLSLPFLFFILYIQPIFFNESFVELYIIYRKPCYASPIILGMASATQ